MAQESRHAKNCRKAMKSIRLVAIRHVTFRKLPQFAVDDMG